MGHGPRPLPLAERHGAGGAYASEGGLSTAILFLSAILFTGALHAQEPVAFQPALGEPRWLPGSREVCWSEPADLNAAKISSEIIPDKAWDCEVANDFIIGTDAFIGRAIFYGGFFGFLAEDSAGVDFEIRIYKDAGSGVNAPGAMAETFLVPNQGGVQVGMDGYGFPTYKYEALTSLCVAGNQAYWMSVRATDHPFFTQWGRACTRMPWNMESVIRSATLGYPEWTPIHELLGYVEDASQEFESPGSIGGYDPCETPIRESSWGAVRALFR